MGPVNIGEGLHHKSLDACHIDKGQQKSSSSDSSCQTSCLFRYSKFRAFGMLALLYTSRDCSSRSKRVLQRLKHLPPRYNACKLSDLYQTTSQKSSGLGQSSFCLELCANIYVNHKMDTTTFKLTELCAPVLAKAKEDGKIDCRCQSVHVLCPLHDPPAFVLSGPLLLIPPAQCDGDAFKPSPNVLGQDEPQTPANSLSRAQAWAIYSCSSSCL